MLELFGATVRGIGKETTAADGQKPASPGSSCSDIIHTARENLQQQAAASDIATTAAQGHKSTLTASSGSADAQFGRPEALVGGIRAQTKKLRAAATDNSKRGPTPTVASASEIIEN